MKHKQPSLVFCLVMDGIGMLSYAIPGLGEFSDAIWAPISGFIFFLCFGGWRGAAGGIFNFIEEILPDTDFIPSFTIMWFLQEVANKKTATSMRSKNKFAQRSVRKMNVL